VVRLKYDNEKIYDREKVEKVLAMFDPEDIAYINPIHRFKMITYNKKIPKVKVKKVGGINDRQR